MILLDRELKRGFQQRPGFSFQAGLQKIFSEQNTRHHPICFLRNAELEMRSCLRFAAFRDERLGKTESEKFVGGIAIDQGLKMFGTSGHGEGKRSRWFGITDERRVGYGSSTKTRTPVALSGPPRLTARVTNSRRISSGCSSFAIRSAISSSRTMRVMPSVQKK